MQHITKVIENRRKYELVKICEFVGPARDIWSLRALVCGSACGLSCAAPPSSASLFVFELGVPKHRYPAEWGNLDAWGAMSPARICAKMHQPRIEPGSHRWQRCILPLDD
jgi:hypothetical protein